MKREQRQIKKQAKKESGVLQKILVDKANPNRLQLIHEKVHVIQQLNARLDALQHKPLPQQETWREDDALKEIAEKYIGEKVTVATLKCPKCGALDMNNTMNGKPWCFRCNIPLSDKPQKAKVLSKWAGCETVKVT